MKFQHGLMVSLVGLGLFGSLLAEDPSITITRVQQRYPWNGKVDFAYTLANLEGASDFKLVTSVTANGQTKAVTNALDSAVTSGDYTGVVDCEALFGELIDPNASLTLKLLYTAPSPLPDDATGTPINIFADLLVIDVTGGPDAETYPTYVYQHVDIGTFNCDVYKKNKIALRLIEKGTFMMGSPTTEPGRGPSGDTTGPTSWKTCETLHQVTLTQDFYYGIFPVTQKQWHLVMGEPGTPISVGGNVVQESKFRYLPATRTLNPKWESSPVENLFYAAIRGAVKGSSLTGLSEDVDADSFLGKLRARTGQERLDIPTEAQWEYACRAGATTATYYGGVDQGSVNTLMDYAWFSRNSNKDGGGVASGYAKLEVVNGGMTHEVGLKKPNAWGLYDTLGNVFEICRDRAVRKCTDNDLGSNPQVDPLVRSGSYVILRGGDWYQDWDAQRCACRSCDRNFTETNPCTGFRLGSWGFAKGSGGEVEDTHPMSLDIREVRVVELHAEETFQHSSSFWGEQQPSADGATVTYVKDGGSETTTFGTFSDDSTCLWSPNEAGMYAFTHAPGDDTLYSKATYVVMPGPVTALWITDHFDAGAGFVHLAFQPLFGGTVVKGEALGLWCEANKSRFQAVSGSTHQNIESATPIPIAPRAGKWNQDLDKGWLWVTVPVGTVDPDRYWKLRIDAK